MSDTQVYNGHGECFWCKTPLDEGDFCICDGSRIAGLLEERDELTAENERLSQENRSLRALITAADLRPEWDPQEVREVRGILKNIHAERDAEIERLRAELATCQQAAFENGRAGDFLTEQAIEKALGVED